MAPVNNLNKLPSSLQPRAAAEKHSEKSMVFFTQGSPFSNFYPAPFIRNKMKYVCNEQYIQSKKAELFNDDETRFKIMQTSNPYEIKSLGNYVKNFVGQIIIGQDSLDERDKLRDKLRKKFIHHLFRTFSICLRN